MPLLEQLSGCTMPYFYLHVGELWPQCLNKIQWLLHVQMRTNAHDNIMELHTEFLLVKTEAWNDTCLCLSNYLVVQCHISTCMLASFGLSV